MVVEEHWSSGEAGAGHGDPESTLTGCFRPNLPQAEKPSSFMFVMVEIDVGRLKRDAPEMTIWDPFLELSDRDKSDPSPLPRRGPTSRISNCSDFVKAREDAGFDAEEISLKEREMLFSGNLRVLLVDMSCFLSCVSCPDPET